MCLSKGLPTYTCVCIWAIHLLSLPAAPLFFQNYSIQKLTASEVFKVTYSVKAQ